MCCFVRNVRIKAFFLFLSEAIHCYGWIDGYRLSCVFHMVLLNWNQIKSFKSKMCHLPPKILSIRQGCTEIRKGTTSHHQTWVVLLSLSSWILTGNTESVPAAHFTMSGCIGNLIHFTTQDGHLPSLGGVMDCTWYSFSPHVMQSHSLQKNILFLGFFNIYIYHL